MKAVTILAGCLVLLVALTQHVDGHRRYRDAWFPRRFWRGGRVPSWMQPCSISGLISAIQQPSIGVQPPGAPLPGFPGSDARTAIVNYLTCLRSGGYPDTFGTMTPNTGSQIGTPVPSGNFWFPGMGPSPADPRNTNPNIPSGPNAGSPNFPNPSGPGVTNPNFPTGPGTGNPQFPGGPPFSDPRFPGSNTGPGGPAERNPSFPTGPGAGNANFPVGPNDPQLRIPGDSQNDPISLDPGFDISNFPAGQDPEDPSFPGGPIGGNPGGPSGGNPGGPSGGNPGGPNGGNLGGPSGGNPGGPSGGNPPGSRFGPRF